MHILLYDCFGSFIMNDVKYYFEKMGNTCKYIFSKANDKYEDASFSQKLQKDIDKEKYDFVFTTNYFPVVAEVCLNVQNMDGIQSYIPLIQVMQTEKF